MTELLAKSPCDNMAPVERGTLRLEEVSLGNAYLVAPYAGAWSDVSAQLQKTIGAGLPSAGQTVVADAVRVLWFGRETALVVGVEKPPVISGAAVTDQSDAWASIVLSGPLSPDVLARLVPVDMREKAMPVGATTRTMLGHMTASITRQDTDAFLILVFRSMAHTLVEEVTHAMECVVARHARN